MPLIRGGMAAGLMMLVMGLIFVVVGGCVSWFLGSDTTVCPLPNLLRILSARVLAIMLLG